MTYVFIFRPDGLSLECLFFLFSAPWAHCYVLGSRSRRGSVCSKSLTQTTFPAWGKGKRKLFVDKRNSLWRGEIRGFIDKLTRQWIVISSQTGARQIERATRLRPPIQHAYQLTYYRIHSRLLQKLFSCVVQLHSFKQKLWRTIHQWKLDIIGKVLSVSIITRFSEISLFS